MRMAISLLDRLDERDRALYARWAFATSASYPRFVLWTTLTHLGGVWCSVLAALLPMLLGAGPVRLVALQAGVTLLLSHLVVQVVKRKLRRERPHVRLAVHALVQCPDKFSFPSGHATAAMSVAIIYAASFPSLALPLLLVSGLVGISRICLGVHYPGDVFVGQAIALATGAAVLAVW
jgi:undecaprenyl-diphosphatase